MSQSGEDVFQRVLREFKSSLKPEEKEQFKATSLLDLQRAIVDIQRKQKNSRTMQNMTRLRAFLEAMDSYSQVLDVFVNVNDFVAFIWGPIKFLLLTASAFAEAFNALLDAYQRIAENLPALADFQAMFSTNPVMRGALEMMFGDIFEFHYRAMKHFRGSVWRQLFHATWKTFETRFQDILENMKRHKELIETRANIIEFENAQRARLLAEKHFIESEKNELLRRRERLDAWLSPVNAECDQEQWTSVREYDPNTGVWILQKPLVRDWIEPQYPSSPNLWISGRPGAGKTVLAALIVEEARKKASTTVIHFYCRNNDSQRNSFVAVCRSLIHQLLVQNEFLADYLFDTISSPNSDISLRTQKQGGEILLTCLKAVGNVRIVIDGLDECPRLEQKHIAESLRKFINETAAERHPCRCLFLSQDDGDIRKLLSKIPSIRISMGDNKCDIQAFSLHWGRQIKTKFGISDCKIADIVNMVTSASQGMFLFAKLVMENLHDQNRIHDLEDELHPDIFPRELHQAYDRIINRVFYQANAAKQRDAKRLLALIVCAARPLRWREIQTAVSIDSEKQLVDIERRRWVVGPKDLCGSLVEEGQDKEVVLVHSTARKYLEDKEFVQPSNDNLNMAELCVEYLTYPMFDSDISDSVIDSHIETGSYGFAEYATINWTKHLENALHQPKMHEAARLSTFEETLDAYFTTHWKNPDSRSTPSRRAVEAVKLLRCSELHARLLDTIAAMEAISAPDVLDITPLVTTDIFSILFRIRHRLEMMANDRAGRERLASYYGQRLFKCPRLYCKGFYEGFETWTKRDGHKQRHERPHLCPHADCSIGSVGYATRAELERHVADYHHSKLSEKEFPSKRRGDRADSREQAKTGQKRPGDFICEICGKSFSKASNKRAHEKVHSNERPFPCGICGKAFARLIDKDRHIATVHGEDGGFICGEHPLIEGFKWGCGKQFARGDGLSRHLRSEAGYACNISMEQAQRDKTKGVKEAETAAQQLVSLMEVDGSLNDFVARSFNDYTKNVTLKKLLRPDTSLNDGNIAIGCERDSEGGNEVV